MKEETDDSGSLVKAQVAITRVVEPDAAWLERVLCIKAGRRGNVLVLNDEAHHAYRIKTDEPDEFEEADDEGLDDYYKEATVWIEGLDRIHHTRRIGRCFDLSATPFAPTGKTNSEEGLFSWIVSDFGLTDAIEAGLVKTPRVVIRDDALPDAKSYRSKLYHLYRDPDVQQDLNRRGAEPHEALVSLRFPTSSHAESMRGS